ncbi:MAG: nucleoside monophosphate kinase, partial [Verrucomicrobiota bacterium]
MQDLATLLLCKGNRTLIFNNERRFSLNLIGTSGSGKGTQGEMLSKLFGIPTISIGDLFRDEFRTKS